jgi:hypothetical protein
VLPSLKPLILFVLLVQLMDNFRVFEPIISFNAAANATSLAYSIYSSLNTQTTQLFGSAAATSSSPSASSPFSSSPCSPAWRGSCLPGGHDMAGGVAQDPIEPSPARAGCRG